MMELRSAVSALVLDPMGALFEEPSRLLLEESPPATALRPLLDAIGAGVHRPSEIASRAGQPATSLARPLARLAELELVARETPFGEPERSGKRSLYKLADPFLRLWFSVVGPRRSFFYTATPAARMRLFEERLPRLTELAWEELCRAAVPRMASRLGVEVGPARRYWRGSEPEWDVVASSSDERDLVLGEAKWMATDPSAEDVAALARELLLRGRPSSTESFLRVHHVLFLPRIPPGKKSHRGVHVVDAREVLRALG
jgi:uncharacterized protein